MTFSTTSWSDTINTATAFLSGIDPVIADAITRIGACTLMPNPNIFKTLVDAIVSQQISVRAAESIMKRLQAALPDSTITPEALLLLEHDELRAVGLSTQKVRYIRDLSERVSGGLLKLEELASLDDEEVIANLTAVKGIGRWTAEMILIFSLGRPDVLPVGDLGFLEGVRRAYGLETRPTPGEVQLRGEAWRPYRTFATWYFWEISSTPTKERILWVAS